MKFLGRENEISLLNSEYSRKSASLYVIYGRRRVGKSALVKEFTKGKKALFFEGLEGGTRGTQISAFLRNLGEQVGNKALLKVKTTSWTDAFDLLTEELKTSEQKVVVFFDEYQWMSSNQSQLTSLLKYYWDNKWKNLRVMFILCGSIASFMVRKVVKSQALYGRITGEMLVKKLPPSVVKKFFSRKKSDYEVFLYYLILGGVPKYYELVDSKQSFEMNLERLFFKAGGYFVDEFERTFYSQFKEPRNYLAIMHALEDAPKTMQEISEVTGIASGGGLKSYLDNLLLAEFIAAVTPFEKNLSSKQTRYRIADEFCRFYLKYVRPNEQLIKSGKPSIFSKVKSKDKWEVWLGLSFEAQLVNNPMWAAKVLGIEEKVESWGPVLENKRGGIQIDLAFRRSDNVITVCEAKFYKDPVSSKVIQEVERKLGLLQKDQKDSIETALFAPFGGDKTLVASEYFDHIKTLSDFFKE